MRIGFDAKKAVRNMTGIGNYSRGLVNALCRHAPEHDYILFAPKPVNDEAIGQIDKSTSVSYALHPRQRLPLKGEYWRCHGVVSELGSRDVDLFHGLSNEIPWGLDKARIPSVVTIHDLIFLRLPQTYDWTSRLILTRKTRHACLHADRIVAISQQTKRDIVEFYHVPESKIDVVYQGCSPIFRREVPDEERQSVRRKYGLPSRYLLSVGTFEMRKNHGSVVQALSLMQDSDVHLVLVGKRTPFLSTIEEQISRLGLRQRVHIISDAPTADLPAIYQCCSVFLYMSSFEGFGIPVLEALSSGVPVIAATGSCLEETGGASSLYCAPDDCTQIAAHADYILSHPERAGQMVKDGKAYARNFSEEKIAESMLNVYRKVLNPLKD